MRMQGRLIVLRWTTVVLCLSLSALVLAQAAVLTARLHHTFTGHSAPGRKVAFSPDGQLLASSSVDRTVRLWRVGDRKLGRIFKHPEGTTSVAFSPDGQSLATGSYDHMIRIWHLRDGALTRTLRGHQGPVWSIAFSPDGRRLATGGEDKTVKLWRVSDGALLQTLMGHTLNVWSVAFSPDGQRVVSGSFDKTVRVWRTDTGRLEKILSGHKQAIVGVAVSPDGQLVASGGDDSTVRLWRMKDGALVKTLTGGSEHVYTVAFSPDGEWLASGGRERGALGTLWKQITGNRLTGGRGKTIRLWRVADGALQQGLAEHSDDVMSVTFSPDGKWLASTGEDKTVKLWRLAVTPRRRTPSTKSILSSVLQESMFLRSFIGREIGRFANHGAFTARNPRYPRRDRFGRG